MGDFVETVYSTAEILMLDFTLPPHTLWNPFKLHTCCITCTCICIYRYLGVQSAERWPWFTFNLGYLNVKCNFFPICLPLLLQSVVRIMTSLCSNITRGKAHLIRSHMKCGTYMCLIGVQPPPPPEDPKCVLESWSGTQLPQFCRDPNDMSHTHILGGPGVQCKIKALLLKIPQNAGHFKF